MAVAWTGGDANSAVDISLISGLGIYNQFDYAYVPATSQSFEFVPDCSSGACALDIPLSPTGQVVVEVTPDPNTIQVVPAPGLTEGVQLLWNYTYVFDGLTIGP